ncbi:MAG TPA: hypothetical protein VND22_03510 [Actinomycetota bacterium]|nr:hypothetical protein [Actinomycetota bacterium]
MTLDAGAGSPKRLLIKSGSLGIIASIAGLGFGGAMGALGALLGSVAAALYASGYLKSHIGRAGRDKFYDPALLQSAFLRMVLLAAAGAGAYLLGRQAIIGFLASFLFCFGVLVISEAGRAARQLKTRGVIG